MSTRKLLIFVLIILLIINTTAYLHRTTKKAYNARARIYSAMLYSLNTELQNIPKPSKITPGQTSGHAAGIIETYNGNMQSAKAAKSKQGTEPFFLFAPKEAGHEQKQELVTNMLLENYANDLESWQTWLKESKKFLEYDAKTDIEGTSIKPEQLQKTISGLDESIKNLQRIDLPVAKQTSQRIESLLKENVSALQTNNITAWDFAVKASQKQILEVADQEWAKLTAHYSDKSTLLAGRWLKD